MVVKLQNVKKCYKNFELNCSLEVPEGYVTGLIGPNGAGKSTAFKSILNLIKPDEGTVEIFGKPAHLLSSKERERIGVVLSDSGFSRYLTVRDVIAVMEGMYTEFDKQKFMQKCKEFDVPMDKKIKDFSTGMKAKLQVLSAMCHNAGMLILDEPTAGLDVVARNELLDLMRDYMEEEGRSILISSHISADLEGLCDDLYMIHNGQIVMHEETDVLLAKYGILKVTEEQYETLDKEYILKNKKETFGYVCLTDEKQFYEENYPDIAIEKGNIDEVIMMMIRGEA